MSRHRTPTRRALRHRLADAWARWLPLLIWLASAGASAAALWLISRGGA